MTNDVQPGLKVFKVSEITALVRRRLEDGLSNICIEGEVSNLRRPGSGHLYFTLKDETAQIKAVFFRFNQQRGLAFDLRDGLRVRAHGGLTVYEKAGEYQINIRRVEDAGKGALQERFEQLKKRLHEEGLFDPARKCKLPLLPQHVGIVTSPTGAAIRDILQVITRRFPNLHVLIVPARVQGEGAAEDIAAGIDWLNARGGIDVIITGRGGGSLEDLWCFNEECVARAIARSAIPVISAVGHEIDFTISDFAADLRAPTPSAAAELVVGQKTAFESQVHLLRGRAGRAVTHHFSALRNRYRVARGSYAWREPENRLRASIQQVDRARMRMAQALQNALRTARTRTERAKASPILHEPGRMALTIRHRIAAQLAGIRTSLDRRMEQTRTNLAQQQTTLDRAALLLLERRRSKAVQLGGRLASVNPYAVLKRGYSMTTDHHGRVLESARQVDKGERIITRLAHGSIISQVEELGDET